MLPILKELYETTGIYIFKKKILDICHEKTLCTICFRPLIKREYKEGRGEYWGFPVEETVEEYYCEHCCQKQV